MGLNEAEIIGLIREMAGVPLPGVEVAIGDDAAQCNFNSGSVLLTVDSFYEGIHFTLETYGYSDVGWKAVAASVSDIAAMGGEPSCVLLSLAFGTPPERDDVKAIISGVLEACAASNCALVGGDVCRSGSGLVLSVTVAGIPPAGAPVLRSGAQEGDVIGVTGSLGSSAAGLFILQSGRDDMRARFPGLVEAHLRPVPQLHAGHMLATAGVTAMEDISDGLGVDLLHICTESGVGCEVDASSVPLSDETRTLADESDVDPLEWALGGGEDFQLLFTSNPGHFDRAATALALHDVFVSRIGSIVGEDKGCKLVDGDESKELGGLGYDHFR